MANLGTAAYKLVLDARDFQSSAVQSGKSMRDVQQVMRETTTPAEKLAAKYDAVTKAYEDGQLPLKNYERYLEKLNEEANKSVLAVDDSTDAVDKHATATGKAAASTDGLGGSVEKAVLGYLSFAAILAKVGEALQWTREQTEKAMATFEGMSEARSRLAQIADPESGRSLDVLEARTEELAMRYGESRDKVAQALFSAISEGFEDSLESLVKYGDIVNLQSAATVAGQVPGLFGEGSIDPAVAVSATLAAAKQSRLDFEKMAQAMPIIAQGGAMTGSDPAEAMGILSVMASHTKSGDEAANLFKTLSTKLGISQDAGGADEAAKRQVELERLNEQITETQMRRSQVRADRDQRLIELNTRRRAAKTQEAIQSIDYAISTTSRPIDAIDKKLAELQKKQQAVQEASVAVRAPVELSGKGILGGFEALQGMSEEDRKEFLGENIELNTAYDLMSRRLEDVKERIALVNAEIEAGATGGVSTMERAYQEFFHTGTERAGRRLALEEQRKQEIAREIANERQLATTGFRQQTAIDTEITKMSQAGQSTFSQWMANQMGSAAQSLNLDPSIVRGVTMAGRAQFGGQSTDDTSRDITNIGKGIMSMLPDLDIKADEQQKTMQEIADNTRALNEGLPVVRVQGAF